MTASNPPPPGEEPLAAGQEFYRSTKNRFDHAEVARDYVAKKNVLTARNRREWRCIEQALHGVAPGAAVLDLPCGTGRLEPLLEVRGYRITAADYSRHMIGQAVATYLATTGRESLPPHVRFLQQDAMATDFADGEFDAVICNRLIHHYPLPELRRQVLAELARVTRRVLVISYFSNFALSALRFHLKNRWLSRIPTDRIPIWFAALQRDIAAAGLRCAGVYPVRYGFSPQTYLRLERLAPAGPLA
jgi:ubiquinone/menaquinone biosynthesis C-methylase UbiE